MIFGLQAPSEGRRSRSPSLGRRRPFESSGRTRRPSSPSSCTISQAPRASSGRARSTRLLRLFASKYQLGLSLVSCAAGADQPSARITRAPLLDLDHVEHPCRRASSWQTGPCCQIVQSRTRSPSRGCGMTVPPMQWPGGERSRPTADNSIRRDPTSTWDRPGCVRRRACPRTRVPVPTRAGCWIGLIDVLGVPIDHLGELLVARREEATRSAESRVGMSDHVVLDHVTRDALRC